MTRQVLDFHRDSSYMRDLLLHQLTVEARKHFDPTNYTKTVDRMVELLRALDAEVEVTVR